MDWLTNKLSDIWASTTGAITSGLSSAWNSVKDAALSPLRAAWDEVVTKPLNNMLQSIYAWTDAKIAGNFGNSEGLGKWANEKLDNWAQGQGLDVIHATPQRPSVEHAAPQ